MRHNIIILTLAAIGIAPLASCIGTHAGAGGYATGMGVDARGTSYNSYDLVPVGDRITYTIDISTPEGRQKLKGISLSDAQRLAEVEASRKFNCDRLIDPRFDYRKEGKHILRITVDGRPGNYRTREQYDQRTRQEAHSL